MTQRGTPTLDTRQEWKDANQAFEDAITAGRLSADPTSPRYAGHFMYMGPGKGGDAFKHIRTRAYLA